MPRPPPQLWTSAAAERCAEPPLEDTGDELISLINQLTRLLQAQQSITTKMASHMRRRQGFASRGHQFVPEKQFQSAWAADVAKDLATQADSEIAQAPATLKDPASSFRDGQHMASPDPNASSKQVPQRLLQSRLFRSDRLKALRQKCSQLITSRYFEPVMGVLILANAICLGVAIDVELRNEDTLGWVILENIFLVVFTVEFSLNLFVHGLSCLHNGWNQFDFLVIVGGIFSQWVLVPIMSSQGLDKHFLVKGAQQILIFRMLRLMRLVRAVRLVSSFKALWKLTQGFLHCAPTMLSAALMVVMTLYVFSCVGAEFIAKESWEDEAVAELVQIHFRTLPLIMLSLVQFVNADSIAGLYFPLIAQKPALSLYFGSLILLVSLALMNLVTALVVEDAISSARMDDEMTSIYNKRKMKQLKPSLRNMFQSLDKTGDGSIAVEEILSAIRDGINVPRDLQEYVTEDRVVDLFDAFDADDDGKLTEIEFIDGLSKLVVQDVPVETTQILHMLRRALAKIEKMEHRIPTFVKYDPSC